MEEVEESFSLNEEEIKKVSEAIGEMVLSMQRVKDEQSYLKDTCADLKEKYKIPLPISRKVATFILNESKQEKAESDMDLVDYLVSAIK